MSTRASVFDGRLGHVFMEQGDGVYYIEKPSPYDIEHEGAFRLPIGDGWHRLPFQPFWRWLDRYLWRRREREWDRA